MRSSVVNILEETNVFGPKNPGSKKKQKLRGYIISTFFPPLNVPFHAYFAFHQELLRVGNIVLLMQADYRY